MQEVKFLVYVDKGATRHSNKWLDTLDEALTEFRAGIEAGHEYGSIEFMKMPGSNNED